MPTRVSLQMAPDILNKTQSTHGRDANYSNGLPGTYYSFLGGELNSYPLGRNYTGISNNRACRFYSLPKSDENCQFSDNPWIRLNYDAPMSATGVTVFYQNTWIKPRKVKVTWLYDDTEMSVKEFITEELPEGVQGGKSTYFYCDNEVDGFTRVKIEFEETWLPFQSICLVNIIEGEITVFEDDRILKAEGDLINQGVNVTLEVGSGIIEIYDEENEFNPMNPNSKWNRLGELEPIEIVEYDNGDNELLHTYWYLDTFDWQDSVLTLNVVDSIGYLEKKSFPGSDWIESTYSPTLADLLSAMHPFESIRFSYNGATTGAITCEQFTHGMCTCREYLQYIVFAYGLEVRRHHQKGYIYIATPQNDVKRTFYPSRKFNTQLKFDELTPGLNIAIPTSRNVEATEEMFLEQYFDVGKYVVPFNDIYTAVRIVGATDITGSIRNSWRKIQVDSAGVVQFYGKHVSADYSVIPVAIKDGIDESNYLEIKVPCRCETKQESAIDIARKFYANRQVLEVEALMEFNNYKTTASIYSDTVSDMPGKWCMIQDVNGLTAYARLEKAHVDIVGGMIGNCTFRGYSQEMSSKFRMVEDDYTMDDNPLA